MKKNKSLEKLGLQKETVLNLNETKKVAGGFLPYFAAACAACVITMGAGTVIGEIIIRRRK